MANGPIPSGLQVRHDCDTPLCVNPGHMRLGTSKDNAQDRVLRGRVPRGLKPPVFYAEAHHNHKLTTAHVHAIKREYAAGDGLTVLGRRYGVTKQQIAHIVKGRQRVNG